MHNTWVRVFLTTAFLALLALAATGKSDTLAEDYIDQALKRALLTFALARGTNAVISVAQGTEISMQPFGFGATLTPGEILDPINDLIERFSWVMLLATTSLATQQALSLASTAWVVEIMVAVAVLLAVLLIWLPSTFPSVPVRNLLLRLVLLILFVRFAVPGITLLNHLTYEAFFADQFDSSYKALEVARNDLEAVRAGDEAPEAEDNGPWWWPRDPLGVKDKVERIQEIAEESTKQVVNLIAVFVLNAIVFPLLFLFLGLRMLRMISQVRWWRDA